MLVRMNSFHPFWNSGSCYGSPHDLPNQIVSFKATKDVREEVVKIAAQSRLGTATSTNVLQAADFDIGIGNEVQFFKEKPVAKKTDHCVVANVEKGFKL